MVQFNTVYLPRPAHACRASVRTRQINAIRYGYRAVHIIVKIEGFWVEVQVRTELQHLWASLSEKLADAYGNGIKYGNGDPAPLRLLALIASAVKSVEEERFHIEMQMRNADEPNDAAIKQMLGQWDQLDSARAALVAFVELHHLLLKPNREST